MCRPLPRYGIGPSGGGGCLQGRCRQQVSVWALTQPSSSLAPLCGRLLKALTHFQLRPATPPHPPTLPNILHTEAALLLAAKPQWGSACRCWEERVCLRVWKIHGASAPRLQGHVLVHASAGAQQVTSLGMSLVELLLLLQILKVIFLTFLVKQATEFQSNLVKHFAHVANIITLIYRKK